MHGDCGDDDDLYTKAKGDRIGELKKLLMKLITDGDGDDPEAMAEVEMTGEEPDTEMLAEEEEQEESPLKAEMREYFNPKPKPMREGAGVIVARSGPTAPPFAGKGKGKMKA